ncbi:MAG: sodium-dependent transporter [Eubacteriales bacterium]
MEREKFSSRLGFVLISAGCAIGLGNVWRFPYIVGQYGGAAFVLIYLFFLAIIGLPIMIMEFSVGRASQKSIAKSFHKLESTDSKWHIYSLFGIAGNYLLMMFYTTIAGWMFIYFYKTANGDFDGLDADGIGNAFNELLTQPLVMIFAMVFVVVLAMFVCGRGLQNGVEKITKVMMLLLLGLLVLLAIRSVTLPGASEGLKFYLIPNISAALELGIMEVIFAAMGQAFFTLSLGIGAMAIFGSYIDDAHTLTGEALNVTLLDTFVAIVAGLIIFPACFAFGVNPGQGPALIFVTLPNIFNSMSGGRIWGSFFFMFMCFAAMSTVIGVFENIISCTMDSKGWSRKKAVLVNLIAITLLSLPCIFGYNIWSAFQPLGEGTGVLDLEDFIVSNNLLPLGSLVYLFFCTSRYGWGWDNFIAEADKGTGIKFPKGLRFYMTWILPIIVLYVFVMGYVNMF